MTGIAIQGTSFSQKPWWPKYRVCGLGACSVLLLDPLSYGLCTARGFCAALGQCVPCQRSPFCHLMLQSLFPNAGVWFFCLCNCRVCRHVRVFYTFAFILYSRPIAAGVPFSPFSLHSCGTCASGFLFHFCFLACRLKHH